MRLPATTHDDLMDLATRWSYSDRLAVGDSPVVNGTGFTVTDVTSDPVTGLDARTFTNTVTREVVIGFQGTAGGADVTADALLLTSLTPSQFAAAERYVREMSALHGPVTSVCGNSLGGGLAAYVAARDPRITAVTVNPAPVPRAYAGVDAPNVHNYVSSTDVLSRLLRAGGLEDGVIGSTTRYPGTSFSPGHVGANHVGSDRDDGVYDASMAVPFSVFHPDVVLGGVGSGTRIDVDAAALLRLSRGLELQRADLRAVVATEIGGLRGRLERHARTLPARQEVARAEYVDQREHDYRRASALIGQLLDAFDSTLRSPLVALPPVPAPVVIAWAPLRDQVEDAIAGLGAALDTLAGVAIRDVAAGVWDACHGPVLAESESIARRLAVLCGTVRADLALVDAKWAVLCSGAAHVADEVSRVDDVIAAAIRSGRCPPDVVPARVEPCPAAFVQPLRGDVALQLRQAVVEIRQTVVGELVVQLATRLSAVVQPLGMTCRAVDLALETAVAALSSAVAVVRAATWSWQHTPAGLVAEVAGLGDDLRGFSRALEHVRTRLVQRLDLVQDLTRSLRSALDALPDAVEAMRPYLDECFFADATIDDAYDALGKVRNLAGRSVATFGEVDFQLGDHRARAIDALADRARDLRRDLATTETSLTRMIA